MIARRAVALGLCALIVTACGGPAGTFSALGPCVADGRSPGTYPDLEARLPDHLGTFGSPSVDSGRSCTSQALGTLGSHGVTELRYAGATWPGDPGSGTVIAVFTTPAGQPPLEAGWMQEFYEAGARATSKTENIEITSPDVDGAGTVWRLDALNELSFQTVVVWPGEGLVRVVIHATKLGPGAPTRADHDTQVAAAVQAAESVAAPAAS